MARASARRCARRSNSRCVPCFISCARTSFRGMDAVAQWSNTSKGAYLHRCLTEPARDCVAPGARVVEARPCARKRPRHEPRRTLCNHRRLAPGARAGDRASRGRRYERSVGNRSARALCARAATIPVNKGDVPMSEPQRRVSRKRAERTDPWVSVSLLGRVTVLRSCRSLPIRAKPGGHRRGGRHRSAAPRLVPSPVWGR